MNGCSQRAITTLLDKLTYVNQLPLSEAEKEKLLDMLGITVAAKEGGA